MPEEADNKSESIIVDSRADYIFLSVAVLVWLVPITLVGLFGRSMPFVGTYANDMYRVAGLFTKRLNSSVDFYFQVLAEDGFEWVDVPKKDYASIVMSGNRTRLDRLLNDSIRSPRGLEQRQSLAEYIKRVYERNHPDNPKLESVRFVMVVFSLETMATQNRGWREWPIEHVPEEARHIMSTHYFDGRKPNDTLFESLHRRRDSASP